MDVSTPISITLIVPKATQPIAFQAHPAETKHITCQEN